MNRVAETGVHKSCLRSPLIKGFSPYFFHIIPLSSIIQTAKAFFKHGMKTVSFHLRVILLSLLVSVSVLQLLSAENMQGAVRNGKDINRSRKEKVSAILKLSKIKSDSTRQNLEDILKNDEDRHCREAGAIALGKLGDKKAIPKLRERLKDQDVNVRMRAVWALAKMGDKSGKTFALQGNGACLDLF